jgi:hypothetical protein
MIHRYREWAVVAAVALASAGAFLLYTSLADSRPDELDVIAGACCCALALILCFHLVLHLAEPDEAEPDDGEQSGD